MRRGTEARVALTLHALAMLGMSSVLEACSTDRLISSLRHASEILSMFVRRQSWTLASPAKLPDVIDLGSEWPDKVTA